MCGRGIRRTSASRRATLIGELSTRSEDFRTPWAADNVRFHRTGHKKLHHPVVGDLDLTLLASWAATAERTGELVDGRNTIS
jgi:hypothetical protein